MARETINGISVPVPGTGEPADFVGDLRRIATDLSASIAAIKTAARVRDADLVMPSPPTVTIETSASLTGGTWYRPRVGGGGAGTAVDPAAPFLYRGVDSVGGGDSITVHPTNSFPWYTSVVSSHKTVTNTTNPSHPIRFITDATDFEVELISAGTGGNARVSVDGQFTAEQMLTLPAGQRWVKVTGLDGTLREITVEQFGAAFAGVRALGHTALSKPALEGPTAVVFGDSFTQGAQQTLMGYARHLGRHLGIENLIESGVGGTGYINPGSGGNVKFADRLTHDVINLSPDLVIVAGGRNDGSSSTGDIQTASAAFWSALRAGLPNAVLICVGPFVEQSTSLTTWRAVQDAIFAGAAGYADALVDTLSDPIFTGSGNTSSPTGNGNADTYINGADLPHPTLAGQNYLADWLTSRIARLLPADPPRRSVGPAGPQGTTPPLAENISGTEVTVTNTTTETDLYTFTIPAGDLVAGEVYRLRVTGLTDNQATSGTLTMRARLGGTSLGALSFASATGAQTDKAWWAELELVIRSTGSGGTAYGTVHGQSMMPGTSQVQTATSKQIGVNTTIANDLKVTVQWGTASASNICKIETAVLQKIN